MDQLSRPLRAIGALITVPFLLPLAVTACSIGAQEDSPAAPHGTVEPAPSPIASVFAGTTAAPIEVATEVVPSPIESIAPVAVEPAAAPPTSEGFIDCGPIPPRVE